MTYSQQLQKIWNKFNQGCEESLQWRLQNTKEIKRDAEKIEKKIPFSWIRMNNKMFMPPKAIYRFNVISIKIPTTLFSDLAKPMLKCIWKHRRPQTAIAILKATKQSEKHTIPNFNANCRAIVLALRQVWRSVGRALEMVYGPILLFITFLQ